MQQGIRHLVLADRPPPRVVPRNTLQVAGGHVHVAVRLVLQLCMQLLWGLCMHTHVCHGRECLDHAD